MTEHHVKKIGTHGMEKMARMEESKKWTNNEITCFGEN
jgi:hypothetical protein